MIWTRQYIVAAVAGTPDADAAAGRLLKNQEDIGAAIAGFYGQAAGDRLTELLKQHIMIAVDLVAPPRAATTPPFAKHDERWTANIRRDRRVPGRGQSRTGPRRTSSTCSRSTSS